MSQKSFNEAMGEFFSYVKLFLFLAVVGGGGYWFYTHRQPEAPVATTEVATADSQTGEVAPPVVVLGQMPSEVVKPVMDANLAVLLNDFSETPVELLPSFTELEKAVSAEKSKPGKLQPAWGVASQLCQQMRLVLKARNTAAEGLARQTPQKEEKKSAAPKSKVEEKERLAKETFFAKNAAVRWTATVPAHKSKIEAIFRQLLATEARLQK